MAWRVARSLDVLLGQLNAACPSRDRAADGSIGDAAHATRDSDHNPWYGPGIVTARDYTHDPGAGADMAQLSDELRDGRDNRIKYVIFNGWIMDSRAGMRPWDWVRYTGSNSHAHHLHLSVLASPLCDDVSPWNLPLLGSAAPAPQPPPPASGRPTIQRGSTGDAVKLVQRWLGLSVDGVFGPQTDAKVRWYQKMRGLDADGVVGPLTWAAMGL